LDEKDLFLRGGDVLRGGDILYCFEFRACNITIQKDMGLNFYSLQVAGAGLVF